MSNFDWKKAKIKLLLLYELDKDISQGEITPVELAELQVKWFKDYARPALDTIQEQQLEIEIEKNSNSLLRGINKKAQEYLAEQQKRIAELEAQLKAQAEPVVPVEYCQCIEYKDFDIHNPINLELIGRYGVCKETNTGLLVTYCPDCGKPLKCE